MKQKIAAKIERANKLADRKRKAEGKTTRKEKERMRLIAARCKLSNQAEYFRQWKDQGCPDVDSPKWLDHLKTVQHLFLDENDPSLNKGNP